VLEILFAIFVAQFNVSVEYFFSVLFTPYCFYQMSGEKRCSIVCTSKSEAEVTNNEKLHLRFYTTDATNLTMTDTKHRAASLRQLIYTLCLLFSVYDLSYCR